MSMRYPGGLIAPTPVNQQYPSGVWTGQQSAPYQAGNVWAYDSSFKNTTLLLHGDGATRSFTQDASTNNFQITLNGDTKPNNLTPFITNGYWSNSFNGGRGFTLSGTPISTSTYTIESWVNVTATTGLYCFYSQATGGNGNRSEFYLNVTSGTASLNLYTPAGSLTSSSTFLSNTWTHVVVQGTGSSTVMYINGVAAGSTGAITIQSTSGAVGEYLASGELFNGYISNLRITSTSVYSGAFTPSTTPLTAITGTTLLTCQSNRFVDNSASPNTITVQGTPSVSMQQPFTAPSGTSLFGSGYFDGSGDYLVTPSSTELSLGTGAFCVEFWVYITSLAENPSLINSTSTSIFYEVTGSNRGLCFFANGAAQLTSATTVLPLNSWHHVVVCRNSGGTLSSFINGSRISTASSNTSSADFSASYIGRYIVSAAGHLFGYMSNVRMVKASTPYDPTQSTITVPTTPLTLVSGTSLLTLQTNGPENNNGFLDSSLNSFPVTRNGNPTQGAYSPYGANWSSYLGTGNGFAFGGQSAFALGTGDYTIECWFYKLGSGGSIILDFRPSGTNGNYPTIYHTAGVCGLDINGTVLSTGAVALNTWNHMALVRASGVTRFYINGTQSGSSLSDTRNYLVGASRPYIGINGFTPQDYFDGYISNVRIVKGTAVYTSDFTPSTTPLTAITNTSVLTLQSNRFIDNSANNFTVTPVGSPSVQRFSPFQAGLQYGTQPVGGSGYFDGSGDYLAPASSPAFAYGTGNLTFECWIYVSSASDAPIYESRSTNSNTDGFTVTAFSSTVIRVYTNGVLVTATVANYLNAWTHVAYTRQGSTNRLFVNGVLSATATASDNFSNTTAFIGAGRYASSSISAYFTGYIADVRILKGTAQYTATFTPPVTPLTAVSGTSLLLSYNGAAIFDNSGMSNLETVGNAQIDTSIVKYGTSSMYFDGNGDCVSCPASQSFAFGTGDFTVEAWVYLNAYNGTYGSQIAGCHTYGVAADWLWNVNTTGKLYLQISSSSSGALTSTNSVPLNQWTHVAVVRSNGIVTFYINGINAGGSGSYTTSIGSTIRFSTGSDQTGNAGSGLTGYIDDLRITKGVARYVTNFTPPVARMPNQ